VLAENTKEWNSRRKLVYQWKGTKNKITKVIVNKENLLKIRPSGSACILPLSVEDEIARWIRYLRSEGIPVSNEMARMKSMEVAAVNGFETKFKACNNWLNSFKKRNNFASRSASH
jgi:hypothetical protein